MKELISDLKKVINHNSENTDFFIERLINDYIKEKQNEQLLQANVSCSSDGCYECGSKNLRPKEYNCLDCGHDGYCN